MRAGVFFEKGDQIRLLVYSTHMMITLPNPRDKFFDNSLRLIMDILKKEKIVVTRIGYISTFMLGVQEANLFKNNAFDDNEILLSDEYQLSYYKLVNINNMKVNCWKRYMTEAENLLQLFLMMKKESAMILWAQKDSTVRDLIRHHLEINTHMILTEVLDFPNLMIFLTFLTHSLQIWVWVEWEQILFHHHQENLQEDRLRSLILRPR